MYILSSKTCEGLDPSAMEPKSLCLAAASPELLSFPFAPEPEAGCGSTAQDISSAKDCSLLLLLTYKAQALQSDLVANG